MRDYVLQLAASKEGFNAKLNAMREYLQAYILRILHDQGFFRHTAFLGGTALRFLYQLPRFSEDLDFSTVTPVKETFVRLMEHVKRELTLAGYTVSVHCKEQKTVQQAMIRFEKLMHEAGISPLASQKFSVKIDVDTNPPEGAQLKTELVTLYFPISFLSYDTPSLFAGKTHALLTRKYTKGRDFFDLGWYLSRWKGLSPNMQLLQNSLRQTGYPKELPTQENWRVYLQKTVQQTDWKKVEQDIVNFLENPSDIHVFSKENILKLLAP